ncbi:aspartate/glutamate racemase family protein [Extibacter muris]|uniref:aspartate/glutamate racemase family protein n=1 Tax=Extibacter muris TaxID=1796622 RepID=UPI001D06BC27|nr:aspartate/glutamate racemase family protein [Extibacter muris]MCB6200961.1 aspartate/glutamate racemase family protein [Extibacter muris]MCQ4662291.1 aspartate/glutamate racemase family protein [Extibacter muris]MCQ4691795.1 aspartate/glutamate racemase family protein [Extibacter muris]
MSNLIKNYGYIGPTTPNQRYFETEGQIMNGFPVGILQLYNRMPFFPGNISNAYTYNYPVKYIQVEGADIENILRGDMNNLEPIIKAAKQLQTDGCRVISASCGFFGHYQAAVADALEVPVYLSALVQAPWALVAMNRNKKLGVVTANATKLSDSMCNACGITTEMQSRIVLAGVQNREEFSHALTGQGGIDYDKFGRDICDTVRELLRDNPDIGALLLECADMPTYAHLIQAEHNLPVYDAITMIDFAKSVVTQTPYYGFL